MIHIRAGLSSVVLVLAVVLGARAAPDPLGAAGAVPGPLRDINPAPGVSSQPWGFVSFGALTFFTADDGIHGRELWRTDGTAAGTALVKDINPAASNNVDMLFAHNDRLFFSADDGVHGRELWISDGTAAGTALVTDILTGSAGGLAASYRTFAALGDAAFFAADDGVHGPGLWRSDGTAAGTALVKALGTGDWGVLNLTVLGDTLFFSAETAADTAHPWRLWRSDGTAAGTSQLTDYRDPQELVVIGDRLYFAAYTSADARVVVSTDGTLAGTSIKTGLPVGPDGHAHATLMNVAGLLYMRVSSPTRFCGETRTPNWSITSCTWAGSYGPDYFTAAGGDVFFGYKGDGNGAEIWRSAGGTGDPELAYDINPGDGDSTPYSLMNVNGRLYFVADDGAHGQEIWSRDPISGRVNIVADIVPGAGSVEPFLIHHAGSMVFFLGVDAEHGGELWVVPGTLAPDGEHKAYLPQVQRNPPASR